MSEKLSLQSTTSSAGLRVDMVQTELIICFYHIFSLLRQVLNYYTAYFLKNLYIIASYAYSKNVKTRQEYSVVKNKSAFNSRFPGHTKKLTRDTGFL